MNLHEEAQKIGALVDNFVRLAKDKKWIQKAVKRPGRFKGMNQAEMKKKYNKLKNKKDKTKEEISEMRALGLGIRLKGKNKPGGAEL